MIYTPAEKNILSLMKRTDFRNIGRNEIVSLTSKIAELRPDVAKEIIAQFPEYDSRAPAAQLPASKCQRGSNRAECGQ